MEKIDTLKFPPIIGKSYLVPCIVEYKEERFIVHNSENMLCSDNLGNYWIQQVNKETIIATYKNILPIINYKHSDKENGQNYEHYHTDSRFLESTSIGNNIKIMKSIRWNKKDPLIEYINLKCISNDFKYTTPPILISKSKLKHNCIYKGKCPHRGYDLSQVKEKDGIIVCPLHGLKFDNNTKHLLNYLKTTI